MCYLEVLLHLIEVIREGYEHHQRTTELQGNLDQSTPKTVQRTSPDPQIMKGKQNCLFNRRGK